MQTALGEKGLYNGAVDASVPGQGTMAALDGYFAPLEENFTRSALTAMHRAENIVATNNGEPARGYGRLDYGNQGMVGRGQEYT